MNSEYCKQALIKVGNPNVLVNLVSRRVRQLTSSGSQSRPLINETVGLGAADIALVEIIEEKLSWDAQLTAEPQEETPAARRKKKRA